MNAPFRSSMRELHSRAGLVLGWLGIFLFFMGSLALYRYEIARKKRRRARRTRLPDPARA